MDNEELLHPLDARKAVGIEDSLLEKMYSKMMLIRMVEEQIADLVEKGEIVCPCHLYIGQEAIATGVCTSISKTDYVFSNHRSHGHYLAKGGSLKELFAEIYGRETGCSRGNGGSMHLISPKIGFMGSSATVGGSIPVAVGAALASSLQDTGRVAVSFFGDGAATEGVLYEALNFAALKCLPVIFVCENNLYSTHMHISSIQSNVEIHEKARAFGMPSDKIDGNNVIEVYKTTMNAVENARLGKGPAFMECMTYRWRGHVGPKLDLDKGLRTAEELDRWIANCPIKKLEDLLFGTGLITTEGKDSIVKAIEEEIKGAIAFAKESPYPVAPEYRRKVFH